MATRVSLDHHEFTGTYDGRVGACLQCERESWDVIADLVEGALRIQPVLDAVILGTPMPRRHHVERWAWQLAAAVSGATCRREIDGEPE